MMHQRLKVIWNDRKLIASLFSIIFGTFFVIYFISKDKVESKSDLVEINSTLIDFSFNEYRGFRNHTYSYYLYLKGYKNKFQISADLVDYFNRNYFEQTINRGDNIKVEISKHDFNNISTKLKIQVFGISTENAIYMNSDGSIIQFNSTLPLYMGLIFIFIGLLILYIKREKLIKKNFR